MTPREPRPQKPTRASSSTELAARRLRALQEPLSVRRRPHEGFPLLEVRNPVHRTSYLVMFPEFPAEASALCTCSDFARRGLGSCKHLAAAHAWLSRHPEPPITSGPALESRSADPWGEIDRRLAEPRDLESAGPRELARPGGALFDAPLRGRPGRSP